MATMLASTKLALRITTDAFDSELQDLIDAGIADLGLAGVINDDVTDPLVKRAVITYVRMMFGQPDDYDRLLSSYEAQKGQMQQATGYTDWLGVDS
jgi:hypothetical protein